MAEFLFSKMEQSADKRRKRKQYRILLLVLGFVMATVVAWGLKLTGISATAYDTEVEEALEHAGVDAGTEMAETTEITDTTEIAEENSALETETPSTEETTEQVENQKDAGENSQQEKEGTSGQNVELTAESESGVKVAVTGDMGAFPCPADEITVKITELSGKKAKKLRSQIAELENDEIVEQYFFDISLMQGDVEIEPEDTVSLAFTGIDTEGLEAKVYHFDSEQNEAEELETSVDDEGIVKTETDHFSEFGLNLVNTLGNPNEIRGDYDFSQLNNGGYYKLSGDAYANTTASVASGQSLTLDLNGYCIYYKGTADFITVGDNAILNIIDSSDSTNDTSSSGGTTIGNQGVLAFKSSTENQPKSITYYVTESVVSGTTTTETLVKHTVTPKDDANGLSGIVGENSGGNLSIVKVGTGGTFNMDGGLLTIRHSNNYSGDSHIIFNNGTTNIMDGYICGGIDSVWGGGIYSGAGSTLNMKGGVVAANSGTNGGGICIQNGTFHMSGGIVSGNSLTGDPTAGGSTRNCGFGGGVYALNATVEISGGYITNNSMSVFNNTEERGNGCHGGGGIATEGKKLTISGGYITGNYSREAGGGVYAGHYIAGENGNSADFTMTGGTVASNVAYTSEGGGIRISGHTNGIINGSDASNKVYITNNKTNSDYDWGGGGIFVQKKGQLQILNTSITGNTAGGFGGGVGACPTGETLITHDQGAAIYSNRTENNDSKTAKSAHMSSGGYGKDYDRTIALVSPVFFNDGKGHYSDYFCIRNPADASNSISLVTGIMLGGGGVTWNGSCDGNPITINKSGYAAAKYMFGLDASPEEGAVNTATDNTRVFISGNSAYTHGGGIMTNGKLILGTEEGITNTSKLSISGTKKYSNQDGTEIPGHQNFKFRLTNEAGTENYGEVTSDESTGKFTITPTTDYNAAGNYTYYLEEVAGDDANIKYDTTRYKIEVTVDKDTDTILGVTFTNYKISNIVMNKVGGETISAPSFELYYPKRNDWSTIKIYTWLERNGSKINGAYPGVALDKLTSDQLYYKYTPPEGAALDITFGCIFSNGSNQEDKTADIRNLYGSGRKVWLDNAGGVELSVQSDTVDLFAVKNQDGTCDVTIKGDAFKNYKLYQYQLPETGSCGTTMFTIVGLLLIAGSLWYGCFLKCRRANKVKKREV